MCYVVSAARCTIMRLMVRMGALIELVEADYSYVSMDDDTLPDFITQGAEKSAQTLMKHAEKYRSAAKDYRAASKRDYADEALDNAKAINKIAWLVKNGRIKDAWESIVELDRDIRRGLPETAWGFIKRWGS